MKKFTHELKGTTKMTFPSRVIFIDTETKQEKRIINNGTQTTEEIIHHLFFGVAQYVDYDSKKTHDELIFYHEWDFWEWVENHTADHKKLIIIGHNMDFDFRVLRGFTYLSDMGYELKNLIADGSKFLCTFNFKGKNDYENLIDDPKYEHEKRKTIQILDTVNWFKVSLRKLGEQIGDYKLDFPSYEDPIEKWIIYCKQDVNVLRKTYENWINFLKENNLGTFSETLAKQALTAFKYRFLKHKVIIHCNKDAVAMERQAYYGGRTECYFIGKESKGKYYKFDVNSMYPYVMRNNVFPAKLQGVRHIDLNKTVKGSSKNIVRIALCNIDTKKNCIPYRYNKRLCFPVGTMQCHLCEPEIQLAEKMGAKVEILKVAYYEATPLFQFWVDECYALRRKFKEESNNIYQFCIKILMNSLYGKMGQKTPVWKEVFDDGTNDNWIKTFIDAESGKTRHIKCISGKWFEQFGEEEGFDSFVAIAAFVTSYARVYLYEILEMAGHENCYYMDTDSVIVNEDGKERLTSLLDESELGKLKIEKTDDTVEIYNLKDYVFGGETVLKGVSKNSVKLSENKFLCEQWEHLNGALMRDRMETVVTKKIIKNLSRNYNKGVVTATGRVKPYSLDQETLFSL